MNDTPAPKRSSKIFLWIFLGLVLFSTLLMASLPTLLSTQWAKGKILGMINKSIPGKIEVGSLSIGWLGPQKIVDVKLTGPDGEKVLTLGSLNLDVSLFSLATSPRNVVQLNFNDLNAFLSTDKEGVTNLARALDKSCCKARTEGANPVDASLLDGKGNVAVSSNGTLAINLNGRTKQGSSEGTFTIDAEVGGKSSEWLSNGTKDIATLVSKSREAGLKLSVDVVNFPVEVIDQLVALQGPEYAGLVKSLLGNSLNLSVRQKAEVDGIVLNVTGSSPTLSMNADALLNDSLSLQKAAVIEISLSNDLLEKWSAVNGIANDKKLISPTTARLTVSRLDIPSTFLVQSRKERDIKAIGLEAAVDLSPTSITLDSGKTTLALKQLHGDLKTASGDAKATLSLVGEAVHQGQPIRINIQASVPKTPSLDDLEALLKGGLAIEGSLNGAFPQLAGAVLNLDPVLADLFGKQADVTFNLGQEGNKARATFAVQSEHVAIPKMSLTIDDKIRLLEPAQIALRDGASLIQRYIPEGGPRVIGPLDAELAIQSLAIPLSALSYLDTSPMVMTYKMLLDAKLKVPSLRFEEMHTFGGTSFNDIVLKLDAEPKKRPEIALNFSLEPEKGSSLADIIGKNGTFQTYASLGIGLSGHPTVNVFSLQIVSDLARLEASGEMREGNRLVLDTPSLINYTLTTAGMNALGLQLDSYFFDHDTPLQLTIDSSFIPLSLTELSKLRLNGKLLIDDLQLMKKGEHQSAIAALDNLKAEWTIDAAAKRIAIDFSGLTRLGDNAAAGKVDGALAIDEWMNGDAIDFNNASLRIDTMASNLPTELIAVFSGQNDLVPIIGSALDLDVKGNLSLGSHFPGSLSLNLESEHLRGGLSLTLADAIALNTSRPAEFTLDLTPQGYAALRKRINPGYASDFLLEEGARANIKLKSLKIPRNAPFIQAGMDGYFSIDHLSGIDRRTKEKVRFDEIKGSVKSANIADRVEFAFNAKGQMNSGVPSQWNVNGALDKGFSPDGSVNDRDLSLSLDATLEKLPVPLLCQFACVDPSIRQKLEAMIGSTLDAKVKANLNRLNGPVFVDLKGNNGHLSIDAVLSNGYVYLNRDMTAELKVTPQLSEYVLDDLIPVLNGMLSAAQPIRLTIAQQGFAVPLRNPSIDNITIGRAMLDMGKVTFSNDSHIAKVLSLLVSSSSDHVLVWLTPAYVSLNQGYVKLERVDMLISDRYPIAAWGDADIGRDRVNMVIGLSGAAIRKAFNIGGIPNNYFLQLPLKGKLHNPSIDKAKAAGRISALVAQSQGGPQGLVLGTVLDIATGGLNEASPPSPTTNPLPWANMMQEEASSGGKKDKGEGKIPNPIDEIGKGAKNVLKNIFK